MSAERIAELKTQISALESAEMKLTTGEQVVELTTDTGTVKYSQARLGDIRALLASKRAELTRLEGGRARSHRMLY